MSFSRNAYPECPYWYGIALRANQKYEEAFSVISAFRESYAHMDELLVGADKELENLKFIKEQSLKEKEGFFITRRPAPANTSVYASTASAQGKIVYTSIQEDKTNEVFVARLYESSDENGTMEKGKLISTGEAPGIHNGMAAFSKEGKKMFFTRWMVNNGITTAAIYGSDKTDTGWTKPVPLPAPVNMEGSNSAQPLLLQTENIFYFLPTGRVAWENTIYGMPLDSNFNPLLVTNAGNIVNTAGNEVTPSYHQSSRTLLFSKQRTYRMGGYDIFPPRETSSCLTGKNR